MSLVYEWLFTALFWLGTLLLVLGLMLLLFPASLQRLSLTLDRWISTDPFFGRLDEQIRIERLFYRHHRFMGVLIVAGAGYCLYSLADWVDFTELVRGIGDFSQLETTALLLDGALLVLGLGNLLALLAGIIVLLRPSLLKRFESWGNTWVESDGVTGTLNRRIDVTERWLPRYPRLVGLLTVIGSLYIMSNTAMIALN